MILLCFIAIDHSCSYRLPVSLGETAHSALYLNQRKEIEPCKCELWSDTRLLVIDEISFASCRDFQKMDRNLKRLKQNVHLKYGGQNIIFAGDLRQLEPVGAGQRPIYKDLCVEFQHWVNCYVELNGKHRYREDPQWGELLHRFRDGQATKQDIRSINARVAPQNVTFIPVADCGENLRYATYRNLDRDAINTALFEARCDHVARNSDNNTAWDSLIVLADNLEIHNSNKQFVPFPHGRVIWEQCGEDDIKIADSRGRMDPALKLYRNCPVMLPKNIDVLSGQANGTQALVQGVLLKDGQQAATTKLRSGTCVPVVKASQIRHVVLKHCNDRIKPNLFVLEPMTLNFIAAVPVPRSLRLQDNEREQLKMKGTQLPLLNNAATTGHKLQGSGVGKIFIHSWSYVTNWVYVMLSRVKTRAGLHCRLPLSEDLRKYAMPQQLRNLIKEFHRCHPPHWTEGDYDILFPASPC